MPPDPLHANAGAAYHVSSMPNDPHNKSIMRSLGEFVGHIVRGVKEPVGDKPKVVRKEVEEREGAPGPNGEKVILRRTTIDEVEVRKAE